MRYDAFHLGQVWLDTEGKRIQAHGGSVMYLNGTYYWYGENKEKTTGKDKIWHWGVRCYTSKDLYNWEDKGGDHRTATGRSGFIAASGVNDGSSAYNL